MPIDKILPIIYTCVHYSVVVTNGTQKAVGIVRDYEAATETVTLLTELNGFTVASGNQVDVIAGGPAPLWLGASQ
jgi:hypothetical protein